jgi:hypothetical protein
MAQKIERSYQLVIDLDPVVLADDIVDNDDLTELDVVLQWEYGKVRITLDAQQLNELCSETTEVQVPKQPQYTMSIDPPSGGRRPSKANSGFVRRSERRPTDEPLPL